MISVGTIDPKNLGMELLVTLSIDPLGTNKVDLAREFGFHTSVEMMKCLREAAVSHGIKLNTFTHKGAQQVAVARGTANVAIYLLVGQSYVEKNWDRRPTSAVA